MAREAGSRRNTEILRKNGGAARIGTGEGGFADFAGFPFLMAGPAFWCVVLAGSTSCLGVSVLALFSNHSPESSPARSSPSWLVVTLHHGRRRRCLGHLRPVGRHCGVHKTDRLLDADGPIGSVSPKRPGRIDTRGPLRWNPGCSQAHRREREHRHCERRRVVS